MKDIWSLAEELTGGVLSERQRIYFVLFLLSLFLWPIIAFGSVFIFDSPIHNPFDEIARYGIALTIWTYPAFLIFLFKLGYKLSAKSQSSWIYYALPWIPMVLVTAFSILANSEISQAKPDNYDSQTFKRIDNRYSKDKNHVYLLNEEIKGALPESFEVLSEEYSKDAVHVFFRHEMIPGANPSSFVIPEKTDQNRLTHDNKDYYNGSTPLHVADYNSFKAAGKNWFIDRKQVYYVGILSKSRSNHPMPVADFDSFRVLNERYACDSRCVYFEDTIAVGADPATLHIINESLLLAQDKHGVYYEGKTTDVKDFAKLTRHILNDSYSIFYTEGSNIYTYKMQKMPKATDITTLRRVNEYRDWYADKNRVYYENKIIPNANPRKIEIFPSHYLSEIYASKNNKSYDYSHDGTHVYYRDSQMEGVDIATFKCGYDFVDSVSFAFDKNRYYEGHPTNLIEKLKMGNLKVDSYQ